MKTVRMQRYEDKDDTISIEVYRMNNGMIYRIDLHITGNHKIEIRNEHAIRNLFSLLRELPID